jgi:hypothetical protein
LYQANDFPTSGRFPHYPDGVPDELKPGDFWICCNEQKVPMVAAKRGPLRRAKSTDPTTWRSYAEALEAYETGRFAGVGRVFVRGEGLVRVDLDHSRDLETGSINPRARRILDTLDSYSEVSPSGTGVKVWVRAGLTRSYVKPGFEIYPHGRYFTVTGQLLTQYRDTVEECSGALAEIVSAEFQGSIRKRHSTRRDSAGRPFRRSIDLVAFLDAARVEVLSEVADNEAELKFQILCPWIAEHTKAPETGTFVGQYPSGATFFWCWHSHCAGRRRGDFVRAVAPNIQTLRIAPRGCGTYLEVKVGNG